MKENECVACHRDMEITFENWATGAEYHMCRKHYADIRTGLVDNLACEIYIEEWLIPSKKKLK